MISPAPVWVCVGVGLVPCLRIAWGWVGDAGGQQQDEQLAQQAEQFAELVRRSDRQADQQGQVFAQTGQALDHHLFFCQAL